MNKLYDLTGLVALVTGGGTGTLWLPPIDLDLLILVLDCVGIGLMISQGLAANGAKVYITGRRKEVLEKAASAAGQTNGIIIPYGYRASITQLIFAEFIDYRLQMDATDKESITQARDFIAEKEGKLHILVNKLVRISVDSCCSSVLIYIIQCWPSWPCI